MRYASIAIGEHQLYPPTTHSTATDGSRDMVCTSPVVPQHNICNA